MLGESYAPTVDTRHPRRPEPVVGWRPRAAQLESPTRWSELQAEKGLPVCDTSQTGLRSWADAVSANRIRGLPVNAVPRSCMEARRTKT